MTTFRILMLVAATLLVMLVAAYVWNPLGVPSLDPRGRLFGVIPYRVPSESMAPTIPRDTYVVACTAAYFRSNPAIGDVVVFWPPDLDAPYIKRIVATEGDVVEFSGNRFLLNGTPQTENYISADHNYPDLYTNVVPVGFVFLAGDNREHSLDSRHFGPIPASSIIGKVCAEF